MSRAIISRLIDRLRPVSSIPETELQWILQHARRSGSRLRHLVRERSLGKPLQLVLGTQPFLDLEISCSESVLIPRPETEQLCSWLVEILQKDRGAPQVALEIGTGTGCISLALGKHLPDYRIIAIDVDQNAIRTAVENNGLCRVQNVDFLRLSFFENNLQSRLKSLGAEKVDLVISNPPYIAEHEWYQLGSDIRRYESPRALCSGPLGLDMIREIIYRGRNYLRHRQPGDLRPSLVLEFGQAYQIASIHYWMKDAGYCDIAFKKDFSGRPRFVYSRFMAA